MKKMVFILLFLLTLGAFPQTSEEKADKLLEKAFEKVFEGSYAIYFEGIAYGIDNPEKIFELPAYQVYRGGFFIADKTGKHELRLGVAKSICDGVLRVFVDEESKMMIIDSARTDEPDSLYYKNILVDDSLDFSELTLQYAGTETIHQVPCHKIKSTFPKAPEVHVYYWVTVKDEQLLLMGEYQGGTYDAYWFNRITAAPSKHNFAINIPKEELKDYHGYEVNDLRYMKIW